MCDYGLSSQMIALIYRRFFFSFWISFCLENNSLNLEFEKTERPDIFEAWNEQQQSAVRKGSRASFNHVVDDERILFRSFKNFAIFLLYTASEARDRSNAKSINLLNNRHSKQTKHSIESSARAETANDSDHFFLFIIWKFISVRAQPKITIKYP